MGNRVPARKPERRFPRKANRERISTAAILYCSWLPVAELSRGPQRPEAFSAPEEARPVRRAEVWARNGWL